MENGGNPAGVSFLVSGLGKNELENELELDVFRY